MKSRHLSRRRFLAAAATLPALSKFTSPVAYAAEPPKLAPYLGLEKLISPANDEFVCEQAAMQITAALALAVKTGLLPVDPNIAGAGPLPASYRTIAADLEEAVFKTSSGKVADSWSKWVGSLGHIRRASFYPLADDIVRFEIASSVENKLVYRVGHWRFTWSAGKLASFTPLEEHVASAAEPLFRDVTAHAFQSNASFRDQLSKGVPYWRASLDPASGIDIYGSNGISVGDIDGDGRDEIYVCQPGGLPNRLFKIDQTGSMTDITDQWQAGILDDTSCALFLDLRNTGRQDLVVLRSSGPVLLVNEGNRFRLRTDAFEFQTAIKGGFTGMAAADFDRDGKLDLYLCCYVYFQSEAQYTYAAPYHDAQNGPPNFLFRNRLEKDGSGSFLDCTAEMGMNHNNNRFSFAPAWCDYNGDGWPDLYVANDFGRKNLYRNHQGHFEDVAAEAGVEDIGPGMSAAWLDYDHDGHPDLFVANMWTASGQRIIADPKFVPTQNPALKDVYTRHTKGNSLFRNRGDGTFAETTSKEHAAFGRWAWSSGGFDFNNDGQPELFVTCGMLTNQASANASRPDLMSFFWRQVVNHTPLTASPSSAYENGWNALNQFVREQDSWNGFEPNVLHVRHGDRFYDHSGVSGLDFAEDGRAFAVVDFDNDGRLDIILKSRLGPQVRLLQNNCAAGTNAIAFSLHGTESNRDAIGARIQVDGQTKWLEAGSGFLSQHSKRILFGLDNLATAHNVQITWPSGHVDTLSDLEAGHTYTVIEGASPWNPQRVPFRKPIALPSGPVPADNEQALHDTWLIEPVPLPTPQNGPALLVLSDGKQFLPRYNGPWLTLDLPQKSDLRNQYEIFRRYLFDWRTSLEPPLALLLDKGGRLAKIYGRLPSDEQWHADLAQLATGTTPSALPFAGLAISSPHRDYFKWGAAFLWAGYNEQALPYLQEVLRRTPDNVRVLVLVAQIHLLANRLDLADTNLRSAVQLNANYAEAWSELGSVYEARGDFKQALINYDKALALKSGLYYTLINAGQAADKSDNPARAQRYYEQALAVEPQSPEAANGLGLALAKQDHFEEARRYFEQAIAARRDYAGAINNLGVLYLRQSKIEDATAAFQYGIRVAPDEDILYLNLGRLYVRAGQIEKARALMQQLLDLKPHDQAALHALSELNRR